MTHEKEKPRLFPDGAKETTGATKRQSEPHLIQDALHVIDDVPLILDRIPLKPRSKAPLNRGWRRSPALTDAKVAAHLAAGGNVGAMLRDDQLVVDADPRAYEPGDDPLARLRRDFQLPSSPTVETGGGGKHLYFRIPAGMKLRDRLAEYPGIEFKSVGRQVVIPPSVHPDTERKYVWDPLAPETEPVQVLPDALIRQLQRPDRTSVASDEALSAEWLEEALSCLDVLDFSDQFKWLALAMACHEATDGEGLDVFMAFCAGDPAHHAKLHTIPGRWASFDAQGGVTRQTLFKLLNQAGHGKIVDAANRSPAAEDFPEYDDMPVEEKAPTPDLIDQMNERFCVVLNGGKLAVFMEDEDELYSPPRKVFIKLSRQDFIHYHENKLVKIAGRDRRVNSAEFWLKSPRRREYHGIVLDPEGRDGGKLNLWRGWSVEPQQGDWSLMRELIEQVLCSGDPALYEFVLRWMAFMFQHPSTSPQVAITFRGQEGTGKSTLGRALMAIAGTHGLTVSSPSQFAGRFNAHLRNVAFLFADEAFSRGNREAEGVLKQLVTEPVISFEGKGADIVSGRNLVHLMLASNHEWVVPAGMEARRFAVFDVADMRKGDAGFFNALNAQLESGGLAAMLHDLLAMDIRGWHPSRHVPKTQALADQKVFSLEPAHRFWWQALDSGMLPTTKGYDWTDGPLLLDPVYKGELVDAYDRFLVKHRLNGNASHRALVASGRALGLATTVKNTERCWVLPQLAEARLAFEKALGSQDMFD